MDELLSPKLDIVFKKIFTENLDLLQHFVASMLSIPMHEITGIELTNPEMPPDEADAKFSRLDLRLSLATRQIDIEIQIKKMLGYADRSFTGQNSLRRISKRAKSILVLSKQFPFISSILCSLKTETKRIPWLCP